MMGLASEKRAVSAGTTNSQIPNYDVDNLLNMGHI